MPFSADLLPANPLSDHTTAFSGSCNTIAAESVRCRLQMLSRSHESFHTPAGRDTALVPEAILVENPGDGGGGAAVAAARSRVRPTMTRCDELRRLRRRRRLRRGAATTRGRICRQWLALNRRPLFAGLTRPPAAPDTALRKFRPAQTTYWLGSDDGGRGAGDSAGDGDGAGDGEVPSTVSRHRHTERAVSRPRSQTRSDTHRPPAPPPHPPTHVRSAPRAARREP